AEPVRGRGRRSSWDGWAEDGSWQGSWEENENWSRVGSSLGSPDRSDGWEYKGFRRGNGRRGGYGEYENWSWKDGYGKAEDETEEDRPSWRNWEASYVGKEATPRASSWNSSEDGERASTVKVVGEEGEKKTTGKVSSSYPPVFKAKPGESFIEWKRSVEFWIGGEGGQLPAELVGPRMMVQLKERAAQLVKHLTNDDVNKAGGKDVILAALEKSPLIRQLDKHRVDEHRRRMMSLNRAPGESMESYVTRASIYRTHLMAMDASMTMGEAFYVGHLVDHAHLTRRDRAMVKTKAGSETDEFLVTNALIELASELEGESGYPIGASEPNAAKNGVEWLLQRGEGRLGRLTPNKPPRGVFAAEQGFQDVGHDDGESRPEEYGEESMDDDLPPELEAVVNEAFGIQHRAKQKIAEVRKLRQYYKKPDPEERRRALAEQMQKHPCHACGQYGHWSRECPNPKPRAAMTSATAGPQAVLAATSRKGVPAVLDSVKEEDECHPVNEIMWSVKDLASISEIMWSMKDLAYKVEGRWCKVMEEREAFKFGDGEILHRQETGHYTMSVDECDSGCAQLPEDYVLPSYQDIAPVNAEILGAQVDSDDDSFVMTFNKETTKDMELDAGDDRDRLRKPSQPRGARPKSAAASTSTPKTKAKDEEAAEFMAGGLTPEETAMIQKRREKQAASRAKAQDRKALTGELADYPSLSHCWSEELGLNIAGATASRMRTWCWKKLVWMVRIKSAVERDGDRRWKRNRRWLAALLGKEADVRVGPRRPNRGLTQRLKRGVQEGLEVIRQVKEVASDDGKWVLLEVFAGTAQLSRRAAQRPRWRVLEPIDLNTGWDLRVPEQRDRLLKLIDAAKPDLVTLSPPSGPWSTWEPLCEDADGFYERRRAQLPLWQLAGEAWERQVISKRLVILEQPVQSRAFELQWMVEREEVIRAVVHQCAFGLRDPETLRPYHKPTILEVNNSVLARNLMKQAYCTHKPVEHQVIKGECRDGPGFRKRSQVAAEWTPRFCDHVLDAAEDTLLRRTPEAGNWSLAAETTGPQWEAAPVSSGGNVEENLREQLSKNAMTGSRYDYISFEGEEAQQPRRLRAMVAHVHVTLGHLSNDRLARMFVLSGAQKGVIALAKSLRCQICAMVRPPGQQPKVSYRKPKQFNERISGDTFYVWDIENKRFAVTHFIDGLTDYHIGDLTENPDSNFAREVLTDLWYAVFGPPDVLLTDGGMEFRGSVEALNDLFGVLHEVVPEGAKWRMGQAERHGAVIKLMMMRMVRELNLKGFAEMRRAALSAFVAKNRTCNNGGVSPMQAVTGRNTMLPGAIMDQITSGRVRFRFNEAATKNEAVARAERIRAGAVESFHWLDAHQALRKALASKSKPPDIEGIKEGTVVYVYEPPPSRRGLARRLQDNLSWAGPGVVVCVEKDDNIPKRLWIRLRGKVKAYPLEKVRLATADEATSAQFITDALQEVEAELKGGNITVEGDAPAVEAGAPVPETAEAPANSDSSSSSSTSDAPDEPDGGVGDEEEGEDRRAKRAKLLEDLPWSVKRTFAERRRREEEEGMDPHQLDFHKKQRLFEKLSKQFGAPTKLQEADLRNQMEKAYAKVRAVRKVIRTKKKEVPTGSRQARGVGRGTAEVEVLAMECDVPLVGLKDGELEAMIHDTMGHWTLWTGTSSGAGVQEILEVSGEIRRTEMEGVTEVVTGRARAEYKWGELDASWKEAYVEPLKKAIQVYVDHSGIRGVPQGQMVDPARILGSRFVLTNKGGETLGDAELRARWIFGGHRDPDAGLYATSSPTASLLGHNLINFVAVQKRWVVHYEDVSAAFLQGKELPRQEKIYVKVPKGYPDAVIKHLVEQLGKDCRADLVELTKAGFGLPESPRLWYLEYKDCIQDLGLEEMKLIPGVFRAFHPPPRRDLRAMASIHVDDTRFAGDETSGEIWDRLRERLKFGKHRQATEGWVKFCGRWERQDPHTLEMEYSMDEYVKNIPLAKVPMATGMETGGTDHTTTSPSTSSSSTTSSAPGASATSGTSGANHTTFPSTSTSSTTGSGPGAGVCGADHTTSPSTSTSSTTRSLGQDVEQEVAFWDHLQRRVVHGEDDEQLSEQEKKVISSIVGQLNWAARQGRYDLSYGASLVQQLSGHGRRDALRWLNLGVKRAQEPLNFKVRNLGCAIEDVLVVSVSDAAYGAMPGGHSQGGNLVLFANPEVLSGVGRICILEGNSTKIHRVVRCSMSAEISSMTTSYEHGDFVRAAFVELVCPDFKLADWKRYVSRWRHVLTTDAKTGYDAISSEAMPADRKIAIDVAVLRQAVLEENSGAFVR
ncbi:TY4B-J, partial [Symbiodinium sp. CCMP2592]